MNWSIAMNLKQYMDQDTAGIRKLSVALCDQAVLDGWLHRVDHPNISVGSGTIHLYLQKEAKNSLLKIATKYKFTINSAYRTLAQQYVLKKNLDSLVANIGSSNHGSGLAIDIEEYDSLKDVFESNGWSQSYPSNDPVHFDFDGVDKRIETIKSFQRYWNRFNPKDKIDVDGIVGNQVMTRLRITPVEGF
jgi:hypothetical protein